MIRGAPIRERQVIAQSVLAAATLSVVLLFEDTLANVVIMTAVASSTCLVFVNPTSRMAQTQRLVGGHVTAAIVALAFSYLIYDSPLNDLSAHSTTKDIAEAATVGLAILVMCRTRTEHAPAAGTALGLVIAPWSFAAATAVVLTALALAAVRLVLRDWLVDLV